MAAVGIQQCLQVTIGFLQWELTVQSAAPASSVRSDAAAWAVSRRKQPATTVPDRR